MKKTYKLQSNTFDFFLARRKRRALVVCGEFIRKQLRVRYPDTVSLIKVTVSNRKFKGCSVMPLVLHGNGYFNHPKHGYIYEAARKIIKKVMVLERKRNRNGLQKAHFYFSITRID